MSSFNGPKLNKLWMTNLDDGWRCNTYGIICTINQSIKRWGIAVVSVMIVSLNNVILPLTRNWNMKEWDMKVWYLGTPGHCFQKLFCNISVKTYCNSRFSTPRYWWKNIQTIIHHTFHNGATRNIVVNIFYSFYVGLVLCSC